jgi:hypothetical protein
VINFRFHLVSLVAVFLALAVGVVMGYGVLGQPTVEGLQNRIDTVEARSDNVRAENDALRSQLENEGAALETLGSFAVTARLGEAPVVVVAVRGLDETLVSNILELARLGGADAPGILWLEPTWALTEQEQRQAFADALGIPMARRNAMRERGLRTLANRLVNGAGLNIDPLEDLAEAGFVTYEGIGDEENPPIDELGSPETLALLAVGTGGSLPSEDVVGQFAQAGTDVSLSLAIGEVFDADAGDETRGGSLASVRGDEGLSDQVTTIDNLDLPTGRIVAVLALADLARGVIGHYGSGDDAAAAAPAWWQL